MQLGDHRVRQQVLVDKARSEDALSGNGFQFLIDWMREALQTIVFIKAVTRENRKRSTKLTRRMR